MPRGDAKRRAGGGDDDPDRVYFGTTTVSGDSDHGFRVTPPKALVEGQGLAGAELDVYLDTETGEIVMTEA